VSPLAKPVAALWGVGPERAAQFARLGIVTVADLLLHRPRRYEDRRRFRSIAGLELAEPATTRGQVLTLGVKWFRKRQKSLFELILTDGTARLHCRWWNLPFMEKYFQVGDEVVVFGKPLCLKPRTMDHPETEVVEGGDDASVHLNRIVPIYPLTEGLPQRWLRALIWRSLEQLGGQIVEPWPGPWQEADCRARAQIAPASGTKNPSTLEAQRSTLLPSRAEAIRTLHFPEELDQVESARRRLALDEFTELQLAIQLRRKNFQAKARALPCGGDNRLIKPLLVRLGFKLTDAQTSVLREIRADLRGQHPMRRLLQGDVGSGKTLVAACAALMSLESGYPVALMAPTEILAEQHFRNFSRWFNPLGIRVLLQTGSRKTVESREPRVEETKTESISSLDSRLPAASSTLDPRPPTVFIGTHALIQPGFAPEGLGLVIIDEQHKFGVAQREELVRKGAFPHLLVMTATPIPRTLGLTLYGDLDISAIRESPPGRGRIRTYLRDANKLPQVWEFVRDKIAGGRQAYVIYPRVEDSGSGDIKTVTRECQNLQRILAPHRVGLLHGRMSSREKEQAMEGFRSHTMQVLVTTSLVEVGLDVPNATLMVIENAEQFGLAQLHQLRGRIGRGTHESFCILVSSSATEQARSRLKILEETTDGFKIAEADLRLRGPGELLGPQQSGMPGFRFGNLASDGDLIERARERARQTLCLAGVARQDPGGGAELCADSFRR
jgi:ATP-dependent DNA helicase RecG